MTGYEAETATHQKTARRWMRGGSCSLCTVDVDAPEVLYEREG